MKILIEEPSEVNSKALLYRPDEYAFDTDPSFGDGFSSILVNDIQLEVNDEDRVIAVWGISPSSTWTKASIGAPTDVTRGSLRIDGEMLPGVSVRLNEERFPARFDESTGWLCLGFDSSGRCVEILNGVVIEIDGNGNFLKLWLRP